MDTSHATGAPTAVYEVLGRRYETTSPGFADAIATAHAERSRPRCLCIDGGVEMYVARLAGSGDGYIVKRMPETGSQHATDCPSYEPPAELSGLGQMLGSAICEDPQTGLTTLKLDFPLSKHPGRHHMPPSATGGDSAASDGTRLSLRGLLHYLWDQAGLTRWHPGFEGKRNWATVRRHLLQAAEPMRVGGTGLHTRLYVPEPFAVEARDAINARRLAQWQPAMATPGKPQNLMVLIGEVKEIVPARYGFKATVKHVPDHGFRIDEVLYRRLNRRFEAELDLWGASADLRMIIIATFGLSSAGAARIGELSLMPVTRHWLPVTTVFEQQLVERLVAEARVFVRALSYCLTDAGGPVALLLDCEDAPVPLIIKSPNRRNDPCSLPLPQAPRHWQCDPAVVPMPALPARAPTARDGRLTLPTEP